VAGADAGSATCQGIWHQRGRCDTRHGFYAPKSVRTTAIESIAGDETFSEECAALCWQCLCCHGCRPNRTRALLLYASLAIEVVLLRHGKYECDVADPALFTWPGKGLSPPNCMLTHCLLWHNKQYSVPCGLGDLAMRLAT
jgi:hypothetical protein